MKKPASAGFFYGWRRVSEHAVASCLTKRISTAASQNVGAQAAAQQRLGLPGPDPVGEPPYSALFDRPRRFLAGEEQGGQLAQGGLVADDEDGLPAVGPAGG